MTETPGGIPSQLLVIHTLYILYTGYIVPERQLRLYGHVARLPAEDPAHRILFVEIRVGGPCQGGDHRLQGCVR